MVVPPNGWFIVEHPITMDDLGGTPITGNPHIYIHQLVGIISNYILGIHPIR